MNSQFTVTPGEHSSKYISDRMNSALFFESKKRSNYFRFLACSNQQHFTRGMFHSVPKQMNSLLFTVILVNIFQNMQPNELRITDFIHGMQMSTISDFTWDPNTTSVTSLPLMALSNQQAILLFKVMFHGIPKKWSCASHSHLVNILTNVGPNGLLHPSVLSLSKGETT